MTHFATVEIAIDSPPGEVFEAMLDPSAIGQWMFGPNLREEKILHIAIDPQPGGVFSYLVDRNGTTVDHVGRFLVVDRPTQLQFTWAIGQISDNDSIVRIKIASDNEITTIVLSHEIPAEWADYLDRTRAGWEKMLTMLKFVLEKKSL